MQRETATMDEKKCFSLSLPLQWGKEFHTFVFASLERESDSNVRRACDVTFRACFPCVVPEAGSKRKRERKKSSFSTITLDCRIETNDDGKKKKKKQTLPGERTSPLPSTSPTLRSRRKETMPPVLLLLATTTKARTPPSSSSKRRRSPGAATRACECREGGSTIRKTGRRATRCVVLFVFFCFVRREDDICALALSGTGWARELFRRR